MSSCRSRFYPGKRETNATEIGRDGDTHTFMYIRIYFRREAVRKTVGVKCSLLVLKFCSESENRVC